MTIDPKNVTGGLENKGAAPAQKGREPVLVGYLRVSTDEQAESGLGLEAQRRAIEAYASRAGFPVALWFSDEGVSGSAGVGDRPGLLAALDALGPGSVLVVAKRDRLARDAMLAGWLDKEAAKRGARIASAAGEGTDNDDPTSVLMRQIVDAFAQYERAVIRMRIKSALAAKKAKGERVGGVPFGYRQVAGALLLDETEQEALELIATMRASGSTLRAIGEALAAAGYKPKRGYTWHPRVIQRLAGW